MPVRSFIPELHGDGFTDDRLGIEAALNRRPFWWRGKIVRPVPGLPVRLPSGAFRSTAPLVFEADHVYVADSSFDLDLATGEAQIVVRTGVQGCRIEHCYLADVKPGWSGTGVYFEGVLPATPPYGGTS